MKERYMHIKVGFKNNGLITAIDDFSIADGGVPEALSLEHPATRVTALTLQRNA